jgi:2-oxo-4-hydroxy-4-carboxy-5-ureidoimidazoline decarboxylase
MTAHAKVRLSRLNTFDRAGFVAVCGGLFEHSPWIAERTWEQRPFGSVEALHGALVKTVNEADDAAKLALIRAHPDLVGRLAREGRLTQESTSEQAAAGLTGLTLEEVNLFEKYNHAYREKFAFPFIICARENKKESILAAFPVRLANSMNSEISTALIEIAKIARLRLYDRVVEG